MDWLSWLVGGGLVVVLGALVFLFFKFAKGTTASNIVGVVGGVVESVASLLPDDADKLDAHDVVLVVGRLAKEVVKWSNDPSNLCWADCKEEVLKFIDDQRSVMPVLEKLPQENLEKIAEALFIIAKNLIEALGKK